MVPPATASPTTIQAKTFMPDSWSVAARRQRNCRQRVQCDQGAPGDGGGIVLFAVTGNTVRGNVATGTAMWASEC